MSTRAHVRAPELRGRGWLNTGGHDLVLADLRGRFLLLDFWAFCCVNCLHVLDELRPLEEKYAEELVVVGVHSPKFVHEADPEALAAAVERYEVHHPVLDDPELVTWQAYTARGLADVGAGRSGGLRRRHLRRRGARARARPSTCGADRKAPRRRDAAAGRVAVRCTGGGGRRPALPGRRRPAARRQDARGRRRAPPAGRARRLLRGGPPDRLRRARPGRRRSRRRGLQRAQRVVPAASRTSPRPPATTFSSPTPSTTHCAGCASPTGSCRRSPAPASSCSPALPGRTAGCRHRGRWRGGTIRRGWRWQACTSCGPSTRAPGECVAAAGTTNEGLLDGPLESAWFAQTSGLAATGDRLWLADSESSSVRYVEDGSVHTVVGTGLFDFGLRDGAADQALLQHPLGVTALPDGSVAVCDTYNGAVRRIADGDVSTLATGLAEPSAAYVDGGRLVVVESTAHRLTRRPARRARARRGVRPHHAATGDRGRQPPSSWSSTSPRPRVRRSTPASARPRSCWSPPLRRS